MKALNAMSEDERDYAQTLQTKVRTAIDTAMAESERSQWTQDHKIGVSDIGHCREYLRRLISREPFSDEQDDYAAAFIGTAVGKLAEDAMTEMFEGYSAQMTVTVKLRIGNYEIALPGHPDLVDDEGVVDFKTVDGLSVIRRTGPTDKQWFQVMLYAKALIDDGLLPHNCWVSLAFIDRSGREPHPVVFSRQFSDEIIQEIEEWFADVVYAIENREEASKDMPRAWCWKACAYATNCRGTDTDVEGVIDDPVVQEAAAIYLSSNAQMKALEKDKKSAASVLDGNSGMVEVEGVPHVLRWIHVGEVHVEASTRQPHKRLDLRPVSKPRQRVRAKVEQKRKEADDAQA